MFEFTLSFELQNHQICTKPNNRKKKNTKQNKNKNKTKKKKQIKTKTKTKNKTKQNKTKTNKQKQTNKNKTRQNKTKNPTDWPCLFKHLYNAVVLFRPRNCLVVLHVVQPNKFLA